MNIRCIKELKSKDYYTLGKEYQVFQDGNRVLIKENDYGRPDLLNYGTIPQVLNEEWVKQHFEVC
jgi:hypothetical protein